MLGGTLRSVGAVLDVMFSACAKNLSAVERQLVLAHIHNAQLFEMEDEYTRAFEIYLKQLNEAKIRVKSLEVELIAFKEKQAEMKALNTEQIDEEITLSELEEHEDRDGGISARLRSWRDVQHRLEFFIGDNFHQQSDIAKEARPVDVDYIDELDTLETTHYQNAQKVRELILSEYEKAVNSNIEKSKPKILELENELKHSHHTFSNHGFYGGLLTSKIFEDLEEIFDVLNNQLECIENWRFEIIKASFSPVDEKADEEAPTGDEFSKGQETQDKLNMYLDAYNQLLGLRKQALTGEFVNPFSNISKFKGEEKAIEKTLRECQHAASNVKIILQELASVRQHRHCSDMDLKLVNASLKVLNPQINRAIILQMSLEVELVPFRMISNQRIKYFMQLDNISQGVTIPELQGSVEHKRELVRQQISQLDIKVYQLDSKRRYLTNLQIEQSGKEHFEEGTRFF